MVTESQSGQTLDRGEMWDAVEGIVKAGRQIALAVTGGGSVAVSWLLNHTGASRAIVEAHIPYHQNALQEYLQLFDRAYGADEETARLMAHRAFVRVLNCLGESAAPVATGVGCTAALSTRRQRRGQDRAIVSLRAADRYTIHTLHFEKGAAEREEQEQVLSRQIISAIAADCGVCHPAAEDIPWSRATSTQWPVIEDLECFFAGDEKKVLCRLDSSAQLQCCPCAAGELLLLPGSFNPLHDGHAGLAAAASELSGRAATLELSITNVDKPALTYAEVIARLLTVGQLPAVVTRAPTFAEKGRLFPGCHFAIGYDTAVRLLDPIYYGGNAAEVGAALMEFERCDNRFFVAGRLHRGRFLTASDLPVPEGFSDLFVSISEERFRLDISSTAIRSRHAWDKT